jgi:hypothetical protein
MYAGGSQQAGSNPGAQANTENGSAGSQAGSGGNATDVEYEEVK